MTLDHTRKITKTSSASVFDCLKKTYENKKISGLIAVFNKTFFSDLITIEKILTLTSVARQQKSAKLHKKIQLRGIFATFLAQSGHLPIIFNENLRQCVTTPTMKYRFFRWTVLNQFSS